MTPAERATFILDMIDAENPDPAALALILAKEFETAWLKGWEVARAQMVAAAQQFEMVLQNRSYLALTGPKSAASGVHAFCDGLKNAERPGCVL